MYKSSTIRSAKTVLSVGSSIVTSSHSTSYLLSIFKASMLLIFKSFFNDFLSPLASTSCGVRFTT